MRDNRVLTGLCIGLFSAVCYGADVPFAVYAVHAGVTAPDLVFYRALLMVGLLAGIAWLAGVFPAVPRAARWHVAGVAVCTGLVSLGFISSVSYLPVGIATLIYYIYPLMILILSPLVERERLTALRLGLFALAFTGLVIAVEPSFFSLNPLGIILALAGAGGACGQFFFAARAVRQAGAVSVGLWTQILIIPVAFATCLFMGGPASPAALTAFTAVGWPAVMHIMLFMLAFVLQLSAARLTSPAVLGLVFYAEPVSFALVATRVLDEVLKPGQIIGGLLVLVAVLAAVAVSSRTTPAER